MEAPAVYTKPCSQTHVTRIATREPTPLSGRRTSNLPHGTPPLRDQETSSSPLAHVNLSPQTDQLASGWETNLQPRSLRQIGNCHRSSQGLQPGSIGLAPARHRNRTNVPPYAGPPATRDKYPHATYNGHPPPLSPTRALGLGGVGRITYDDLIQQLVKPL